MNTIAKMIAAGFVLGLVGFVAAQSTEPASSANPATRHATTRLSIELLNHLQATLKNVDTVEADFVQEKHLKVLDHTLTIKGHFALQKPDKLIWIVREPVRYAVRVEGEEVRQWDEDTNRVDVIHLGGDPTFKAVSDQIQAWFLGNYDSLAKSYDVDVISEKPLSLGFTPQADTMVGKILKHVELTFAGDERYIDMMVIQEAGGDSTTLKFIHTQINQPIKPDVWRMPPDDH